MDKLIVPSSKFFVDLKTGEMREEQPPNPNDGNLFETENFASQGYREKKLCH